jgi:Putative metal-binding motif/RTX calcium-binding nonapeptide repeat (4 copies)
MLTRALTAALLGALIVPVAAHASTIRKVNATTLRYDASPGIDDNLKLSITDANTKILFDMSNSAGDVPLSVGCDAPSGGDIKCNRAGITRVIVFLGDLDDSLNITLSSVDFGIAVTADGGAGADDLRGSSQADSISGGAGGDDFTQTGGADDVSGGPGFDTEQMGRLDTVSVTLDDVANDGQGGGAQAINVHSDVENVSGTDGNDVLIGSGAANQLDGGDGNDTLVGGGGFDFFDLGIGDDTAQLRDGLAERVMCGDGDDTVTADDIDDLGDACEHVAASGELVRDLDHDGVAKPEDCNDADPAIRPGAADTPNDGVDQDCDGADAVDLDRDRDGVPVPLDCDDGNARIRPNARERYGNKVDEDCNGRADPLQSITTPVIARFVAAPGAARIARLQVLGARAGTRVQVRCRGDGCRFAKRTVRLKKRTAKLDLRKRFGLRRIGRQTLEVRLLRSDSIGRVVRFRGSGGGIPTTKILCLTPGRKKPGRCG